MEAVEGPQEYQQVSRQDMVAECFNEVFWPSFGPVQLLSSLDRFPARVHPKLFKRYEHANPLETMRVSNHLYHATYITIQVTSTTHTPHQDHESEWDTVWVHNVMKLSDKSCNTTKASSCPAFKYAFPCTPCSAVPPNVMGLYSVCVPMDNAIRM